MELKLIPAEQLNTAALCDLKVAVDQTGFIETVAECLKEASQDPQWHPCGILDGGQLVGFLMAGWIKQEQRCWLDRFLIDARFQHRGYGRTALKLILNQIFAHPKIDAVYLSLYAENTAALRLYQDFGFRLNGEQDSHGELIMVLERSTFSR